VTEVTVKQEEKNIFLLQLFSESLPAFFSVSMTRAKQNGVNHKKAPLWSGEMGEAYKITKIPLKVKSKSKQSFPGT
jgi:hypothetical protein